MIKKIFGVALFFLAFVGLASAQYCPPSNASRSIGYNSFYGSNNSALLSFNRFNQNFIYTLRKGYQGGELTRSEVSRLENDLNRVNRRIERAYWDGRITSSEWSFIEFDINNLRRDLTREWNDAQVREA